MGTLYMVGNVVVAPNSHRIGYHHQSISEDLVTRSINMSVSDRCRTDLEHDSGQHNLVIQLY